jgi:formylglycine-generating enzyme required for sulfatase activity
VGSASPPTLVLAVDQGEELFLAEGEAEARAFLALIRELIHADSPSIIVVFTIRSDNYERLQLARELQGLRQNTLSLPPMPKGAYTEVIRGPARRLHDTRRPLRIDEALVDRLLTDIEAGGAKDALPLLAFTLERLYLEYGAGGELTVADYQALGGIQGSIEAAVERALKAADVDPTIPRERAARLTLLRRALIPWLAGIDPDTGAPRRRVARWSEIPVEGRPLIQQLVEQRLLATDLARDSGEITVEPAHESLLRKWSLLEGWLIEDAGLLAVLEGVKRAARDWNANARNSAWLAHAADRLAAAERLQDRPDLAADLEPGDREYLAACRQAESDALSRKRRYQTLIYGMLLGIIAGLVGWINQAYLKEQAHWYTTVRPYRVANIDHYVLSPEAERALQPLQRFRECASACPEMVVLPAGAITIGSPDTEQYRAPNESPRHTVTIAKPFAVSRFDVTFADWDACARLGGCPALGDTGMGRGTKPVINVTWAEAQQYAAWLARMTGRPYRLLTETEWEYAARAGTTTAWYWGDAIGRGNANCVGCGSAWDNRETSPVGSFKPNAFGLYDMAGNVWQWVEDCFHDSYAGGPADGSAWTSADCNRHVERGGSWDYAEGGLRSASRHWVSAASKGNDLGFRLARTLNNGSG